MAFAHKISTKLSYVMQMVWDEIAYDCFACLEGKDYLYRKAVIELVLDADHTYTWILNHYQSDEQRELLAELRAVLAQPWAVVIRSATPVFPSGRYCR